MKLTPIPSKQNKFMKNQREKAEFLKARRSAVCMRRLEYTHGLKKSNSQEFYTFNNDKNNFMYILKGAVLIIEDYWLEFLRKRFEKTNIENNINIY